MLVNFLKATAGYTPEDSTTLEYKFWEKKEKKKKKKIGAT